MIEIYKDVIDYEGLYKVSNFGNIKNNKDKILKSSLYKNGYLMINLCKYGTVKKRLIHQLVAEAFLNHKRCGFKLVVNHINFDKTNNNLTNLEIVTSRENCNKKHLKSTSQYIGVSLNKENNKWRARIVLNSKIKHLGYFTDELDASKAYQLELSKITVHL